MVCISRSLDVLFNKFAVWNECEVESLVSSTSSFRATLRIVSDSVRRSVFFIYSNKIVDDWISKRKVNKETKLADVLVIKPAKMTKQ